MSGSIPFCLVVVSWVQTGGFYIQIFSRVSVELVMK